jgi:hypothetical protein
VDTTFCADFNYETSERRPVFELPIELVDKHSGRQISPVRIEGLQVSFPSADSPVDRMEIAVIGPRLLIRLSATHRLAIGDTPGKTAYERAAQIADAFTEEVKPK